MVDARTKVGDVELPNPVMTASGTSGHGAELEAYFPLARLGAVVVKSLAAEPWAGNPAPRLHEAGDGMLNSVGLAGSGRRGVARGRPPRAATRRARASSSASGVARSRSSRRRPRSSQGAPDDIVAIEVNLSCPNLDGGRASVRAARRRHGTRASLRSSPLPTVPCGRSSPRTRPTSCRSRVARTRQARAR